METKEVETTVETGTLVESETSLEEEATREMTVADGISTAICLAFLIIYVGVLLKMKSKAKNAYDEYIEPLNEKEHKLKKFIPIGLEMSESIDIKKRLPNSVAVLLGKNELDEKKMIMELYEPKYAEYYQNIFKAEKNIVTLFIMIAMAGLGTLLCLQEDASTGVVFGIGSLIGGGVINFMYGKTLQNKIEDRHTAIRMEFPEFVNKLVLLVNAGMTVGRAWEKIVLENKKDSPLQNEIRIAYMNMKNGTPEAFAIEQFGRRCKMKEIMKFTSVLIANLKKGGAEIVPVLMQQSNECWEMRKNAAKELGAKAGVKMMIPMVLMLIAIIIVVGAPAAMEMTGV